MNVDTFLNKRVQVLKEKVMRDEVVLVFAEIGNDSLACTTLIEVGSRIQGISVAILTLFRFSFVNLILVENWIFCLKQIFELIGKKIRHTSGVKTQNRCHVGTVKLQECFVEYCWLWLVSD